MKSLRISTITLLVFVLATSLGSISSLAAEQPLIRAVKSGDQDAALALIRMEADVNATSVDGTTALHWAVYNRDLILAERLVRAGANVNVKNDYGSSPMAEAAAVADTDLLALLLSAGADVDSPNLEGQTALMAVARTGNLDAAKLLLKAGADMNAAEAWGGQTAMMWAASRKHPAMIELLADNGADINARAIGRDWDRRVTSEPRVKELHTGGFTPLLYAVRENCLACVKVLLESGADINKPDPDNVSPLVLALLNLRFDVAKYLVEAGADVNQWDIWGETPLYAAADTNIVPNSARRDRESLDDATGLEVARLLLEKGANPDLQLKLPPLPRNIYQDRAGDYQGLNTGSTPLERAAYGGDVPYMSLLLEYDANVELSNVNGIGPIMALIADGGSRGASKTEANIVSGLELLVANGADLNARNNIGETALHVTTRTNRGAVVRFLVENGADLQAENKRGLTAIDYATGAADVIGFGISDVVGELPEMIALLNELADAQD